MTNIEGGPFWIFQIFGVLLPDTIHDYKNVVKLVRAKSWSYDKCEISEMLGLRKMEFDIDDSDIDRISKELDMERCR